MLIVRRKHHSNLPLLELVHHNTNNVACSSSNPFALYNANESLLSQSVREKYLTVNLFYMICVTPPARYALFHHRQQRRHECYPATRTRYTPSRSAHCKPAIAGQYSDPISIHTDRDPRRPLAFHQVTRPLCTLQRDCRERLQKCYQA